MRIYAVADIHGKFGKIAAVKDVISQEAPDILVIAGDITNYVSPLKTLDQLADIPIPILGIRGNSDFKRVETLLRKQKNTTLLNHIPLAYQDISFLGLNGTIPLPLLSKISFRETHHLDRLKPGMTPHTILVVHPPPRGVRDKVGNRFSAGSIGLRNFIKNHPPRMVLCGHIHEQAGYHVVKDTLVVNCAMNKTVHGAIIDTSIDGCKNMRLKVKMIGNHK